MQAVWALMALAVLPCVAALPGDIIGSNDFSMGPDGWLQEGTGMTSAPQQEGDRIFVTELPARAGDSWYFRAPKRFFHGSDSLYSGFLSYEVGHFEFDSQQKGVVNAYDVVLEARNPAFSLGLTGVFSDDGSTTHMANVRMDEMFSPPGSTARWQLVKAKRNPRQSDFLQCLQNLVGLKIRGGYFHGVESTFLRNVKLTEGIQDKTPQTKLVDGVEQPMLTEKPAAAPRPYVERTCTSTDRVSIIFDRPGCGVHRGQTCSTADLTPSRVTDLLKATDLRSGHKPVIAQNVGLKAAPVQTPFSELFTFKYVPPICSAATLELTVNGDLAFEGDYLEIIGEDGAVLGSLFQGNISQLLVDVRSTQWSMVKPFYDAISISAARMTKYTADRRFSFSVRANRRSSGSDPEVSTMWCNAASCDLNGKIIFRQFKLVYSPAPCFVSRTTSDATSTSTTGRSTNDVNMPLAVDVSFPTSGATSAPADDGAIAVVTDANVVNTFGHMNVHRKNSNGSLSDAWGRVFERGQFQDQIAGTVKVPNWGGDADVKTHFSSAASLPRSALTDAVATGSLNLQLRTDDTSLLVSGKFSPVTVQFPLVGCFQRTLRTHEFLNTHLFRPSSAYFSETNMALPGTDLLFTMHVEWQDAIRYTNNPGGNLDSQPLMRADSGAMSSSNGALLWPNYPDTVEEHKKWPHGYGYVQVRGGRDGQLLGELFLGDYTQYSSISYISDSVTIPKSIVEAEVKQSGSFTFTIWVPPGEGVFNIRSINLGYATATTAGQVTDETKPLPVHSHG